MKKVDRVELICETCNNVFLVTPSQVKRNKKYCSKECMYKSPTRNASISKASSSRSHTEETKLSISKTLTGRTLPQETINKISASLKGREAWNKGLTYKRPEFSEWLKVNGHWKEGQTMEDRFGLDRSIEIKNKLSKLRSDSGVIITDLELKRKKKYYNEVWKITEKQELSILENYDKRGRVDLNSEAYNLDHIVPIIYGYRNNIPPEVIGSMGNLRFIPALDNHKKSYKDKNK